VAEKDQNAGPLPAALAPADLTRVKQATVFLRVNLPIGGVAEGSGFFAEAPGIIMTNAHVLGMLSPDSPPPREVTVFVHSGTPNEFELKGKLLGVDRTNDLAVLRVEGRNLPAPLNIRSASKLIETQKVYIFGFPLGSSLGKAITVSESSVSSLRLDDSGTINQVQVNGGMHPGNSGGPVTDTRGAVVGVAVAGIPGTSINFAIPGNLARTIMEGNASGLEEGSAHLSNGRTYLPVRLTTIDPLSQIREVDLEVWTGRPGKPRPAANKQPVSLEGDSARQTALTQLREGSYSTMVPLPALPAGQVYWAQSVLKHTSGTKRWGAARVLAFEPAMVLERQAALLQFRPTARRIERSVRMLSNTTYTIVQKTKSRSLSYKMDSNILEKLYPDRRGKGTGIELVIGKTTFTRSIGDKVLEAPPDFGTYLSEFSPSFLVDRNNWTRERGLRSFESVPERARGTVESFFETLCTTWEIANVPFPNTKASPGMNWPATINFLTSVQGKRQLQQMHVKCTYDGVRKAAGRREAYVSLSGIVKGTGALARAELGKVSGHALMDIDKGFITKAKVTITTEIATGGSDLRIVVSDDSIVERVDGSGAKGR
jgi:hypothetical protein